MSPDRTNALLSTAEEIRAILGAGSGNAGQVAAAVLSTVAKAKNDEEATSLLEIAVTERDTAPKKPRKLDAKPIDDARWKSLVDAHIPRTALFLQDNLIPSKSANEFAKRLRAFLIEEPDFETRAYLLGAVMYSPYMPFTPLPFEPDRVDDETYKEALASRTDQLAGLKAAALAPFGAITDTASVALKIIERETDEVARVALLTYLLHVMRSQGARWRQGVQAQSDLSGREGGRTSA